MKWFRKVFLFVKLLIKHIYLPTQEISVDFADHCIARLLYILSYRRECLLNSLKFMPLLEVLIKRNSGKPKDEYMD